MSGSLHRLGAIIRADVLIRLRRPSTVFVFLLLSFIAYLWVPAPSTGRALMSINGHRVLYDSAAIGMATAAIGTLFIGMFGFYVISNALRRDVFSRCGYVIASTTMRGGEYIVGKFAGNLAFLIVFTLGYMITAMAMVIVRGEAPLQPLVFAKQYLLLLPPSLVFVSVIAIVFECTPLLRTKFGDVFYFFLWAALMGVVVGSVEAGFGGNWVQCFDVSGLGMLLQQTKTIYHTDSMSIGASSFDATKTVMHYGGVVADARWVLPRIGATLWPLSLLLVARFFFHRFDPARVRAVANEKSSGGWIGRANLLAKPVARLFVRAGQFAGSLPGLPALVRSMLTDSLATIAAFPLAGVAIIGFAIAALSSNASGLFAGTLPIAFAGCAIALSDIACREKRAGTSALVFAAPSLRANFVWWKFGSTLLVAFAFLGVPLVRAIALRPSSAPALLLGVVFIAAAATTLGVVSSNPKTFIVGFLTFWYIVINDKGATPSLDFAGWFGKSTPPVLATYMTITLAFLAAAHAFHRMELRRRW